MRRQLLNDLGIKLGTPIFTGHNANDDAETLIINMFRGERRRFLEPTGGPGMVPRETPFIDVTEEILEEAAEELGLPYKKEPCPYATLSMRRLIVKPKLSERGEEIKKLQKSMRLLKAFHLNKLKAPKRCKYCGSATSRSICRVCMIMEEIGFLEERVKHTKQWRKSFRLERGDSSMEPIGWIGLALLLIARIPDTIRSIRAKRAPEISIAFIIIYFTASVLLTIHARLIRDLVFIILNAIASMLSGLNMILKIVFRGRS